MLAKTFFMCEQTQLIKLINPWLIVCVHSGGYGKVYNANPTMLSQEVLAKSN